jgi:hypothetical protein
LTVPAGFRTGGEKTWIFFPRATLSPAAAGAAAGPARPAGRRRLAPNPLEAGPFTHPRFNYIMKNLPRILSAALAALALASVSFADMWTDVDDGSPLKFLTGHRHQWRQLLCGHL